jgi:hypothetical protein
LGSWQLAVPNWYDFSLALSWPHVRRHRHPVGEKKKIVFDVTRILVVKEIILQSVHSRKGHLLNNSKQRFLCQESFRFSHSLGTIFIFQ